MQRAVTLCTVFQPPNLFLMVLSVLLFRHRQKRLSAQFFELGFGVPRSIYAETSFSATRIIYGVTDINSSPKRPYPAFTQAADTEVSLSSFCIIAGRQCCLSAVPIPSAYRSLTYVRSWRPCMRAFPYGQNEASLEIPIIKLSRYKRAFILSPCIPHFF